MAVIFVPRRTASSALSRAAVQFRCGTIAFAALSRSNGEFCTCRPDKAIHPIISLKCSRRALLAVVQQVLITTGRRWRSIAPHLAVATRRLVWAVDGRFSDSAIVNMIPGLDSLLFVPVANLQQGPIWLHSRLDHRLPGCRRRNGLIDGSMLRRGGSIDDRESDAWAFPRTRRPTAEVRRTCLRGMRDKSRLSLAPGLRLGLPNVIPKCHHRTV